MEGQSNEGSNNSTTIVKVEDQRQELRPMSIADVLLKAAVDKDFDVDKLSKLLELKAQQDKEQSRKEFFYALARFQACCPEIKKSKNVKFSTRMGGSVDYWYAPLSEIEKQIRPCLEKSELTYRWETKQLKDDKGSEYIELTCIITHINGHSETNTMSAPLDDSGGKNFIQQRGSTITYAQRYTLIGALGLSSADLDVDAQGKKSEPSKTEVKKFLPTEKQWAIIKKAIEDGKKSKQDYPTVDFRPSESAYKAILAKVSSGTITIEKVESFYDLSEEQLTDLKSQVPVK